MIPWRELVAERIGRVRDPDADKRMPLARAIERFVRPGMCLNPVSLQARPVAALHALMRRFAGSRPGFEFVSSSLSGNYLQLVGAGMLRRAIASFAGEGYPTPGPSPVIARALAAGDFALESWSMLTISQRLLAGALGVPFLPTRSLAGSDMADELARTGGYAELDDPFAPRAGTRQGVVRACVPDLSFVHCWAADPAGNALCFPPHQENVYGALAAHEGVILTVHRIVDTAFIRRHANLVRIPAERVVAVCEVPFGSHPYGHYVSGVPELRPHANDYAFMIEHREAQESASRYEAWLDEWVFGLPDHDAYLAKLGHERLEALEHLAGPQTWQEEIEQHAAALDAPPPAGPIEQMIVQAARLVCERVREAGHRVVLSGVGQSALAAWLASHLADARRMPFTLAAETGMIGPDPRPADPFLINFRNLPTTTQLTDVIEALGIHACGGANRCLATLGAGQLDRFGNVDSTRGTDGRFLVGSGGANDVASAAAEVLIVAAQRRATFRERVDFVTSPGARVRRVVSTMGVYEKEGARDPLRLTRVFESALREGEARDDLVARIRERCGWKLEVADRLEWLPPATPEELAILRLFDPARAFLGRPGG